MLTVLAPAKINLTLEVLAQKQNGFHEIRSVIQTINLCDTLQFTEGDDTEIKCDFEGWIAERSLLQKAVSLLRAETGCSRGATITLSKRIPLLSGLGGDSSDAAATLRGLNAIWKLGLSPLELESCARRLGSDVTYFLYRGTALLQGQGEVVAPLPPLPAMWVVLLVPPLPRTYGKTGQLYASLESGHFTKGQATEELLAVLTSGGATAGSLPLFNVFDSVAAGVYTGLDKYQEQFLGTGAWEVHLAGSGPSLFTLLEDKTQAEAIYRHLQEAGLESYLTETRDNHV